MTHTSRPVAAFALLLLTLSLFTSLTPVTAAPKFANRGFQDVWEYTDKAVDEIPGTGRGYTWGGQVSDGLSESYAEAPGGKRLVQYFDKARMELNDRSAISPGEPTEYTNGLLTVELVSGNRQDGDNTFTPLTPSTVQVAGDDNTGGANVVSPVYASFTKVLTPATDRTGQLADLAINKAGEVMTLNSPPANLKLKYFTLLNANHNVPEVFLAFEALRGKVWNRVVYQDDAAIYTDNPTAKVFGLPIAEPYWVRAVVAGVEKDVLVQLFERRVLTYTPSNPDGFKVEMGNIGQHYYKWRYANITNNNASCTTSKPGVTPSLSINASLALPNVAGGNQTLCVAANKAGQKVSGAKVSYKVFYKSVTRDYTGPDTGADGKSTSSWDVGSPSKGFEVKVEVTVMAGGETAKTVVSWTPK